jgi:hypothetical protein
MEACESGSMFEDLKDNMNIYATTAASNFKLLYKFKKIEVINDSIF